MVSAQCIVHRVARSEGVNTFWRDRPTFVTGATGLLGGWLVKRLVESGASVVCLVRDWVPRSILLGGELAITSQPTDGTHVQFWIPLLECRHVDVS